jgi:hypothetical protein
LKVGIAFPISTFSQFFLIFRHSDLGISYIFLAGNLNNFTVRNFFEYFKDDYGEILVDIAIYNFIFFGGKFEYFCR